MKKSGELEKASVHEHAVVDEDKYRANGHVESICPNQTHGFMENVAHRTLFLCIKQSAVSALRQQNPVGSKLP